MTLDLNTTPTGGDSELLEALRIERGRATSAGGVDFYRLLRHLPVHINQSDIDSILSTAEGLGYVAQDGNGNWTITTAGQTYLRANRPRRSRITVY